MTGDHAAATANGAGVHGAVLAALREVRSGAEAAKIAKRLPADSGLAPVGVRMKDVFDTAKAHTHLRQHRDQLARGALRYACERLPAGLRSEFTRG